jgi:hypothetical protein
MCLRRAAIHDKLLVGAELLTRRSDRIRGRARPWTQWSSIMDPTNILLGLIVIAMIALLPCGVIMTRPKKQ